MSARITHEGLCPVRGCPAPSDPSWHEPWCGHGLTGSHQHWPKKGMGGHNKASRIVAFICNDCHYAVDNGASMGNAVLTMPDGSQIYRVWNLKNETIVERVLSRSKKLPEANNEAPTSIEAQDFLAPAEGLAAIPVESGFPEILPGESQALTKEAIFIYDDSNQAVPWAHWNLDDNLEELALYVAQCLTLSGASYVQACRAVAWYRDRAQAAGESKWAEAGTTLFSLSRRSLYRMAAVADSVDSVLASASLAQNESEIMALPISTLQMLAQAPQEQREAAFLVALGHQAEFSEATPSAVAHDLAEAGIIERPSYAWVCPACGHEAGRAEFRRPLE